MDNLEFPKNLMTVSKLDFLDEDTFIKLLDVWAESRKRGERDKDILIMHFKDHESYSSIAKKYGITGTRVGQIIDKSCMRIKKKNRTCSHSELFGNKVYNAQQFEEPGVNPEDAEFDCIKYANFHPSVIWSLERKGIETISDLSSITEGELLSFENIGKVSVEAIKKELSKYNLTLKEENK